MSETTTEVSCLPDFLGLGRDYNLLQEHPWLSAHYRALVLGTLLPVIIVLVKLIYDCFSAISLPKPLQTLHHTLSRPFQNFLNLEDLEGPVDCTVSGSLWKSRTLAGLALVESAGWLGCFAYAAVLKDSVYATQSLVTCITWVRFLVGVYISPLVLKCTTLIGLCYSERDTQTAYNTTLFFSHFLICSCPSLIG
jgi:hypothetical protein